MQASDNHVAEANYILSEEIKVDKKLKLSIDVSTIENIIRGPRDLAFRKLENEEQTLLKLERKIFIPSNYVFAELSSRIYHENVYGEDKNNESLHGKKVDSNLGNWQLLTVAHSYDRLLKFSIRGYFGAAYWNPDMQQIIIVHSGTRNLGGIAADLRSVVLNKYVPHINSAITFTDIIINILRKIGDERKLEGRPYIQLFFTGHSLGAWLAQITTFSAKYMKRIHLAEKNDDAFVAREDFEEAGYHASAIVFDPPGCKDMLQLVQDRLMARSILPLINSLHITTYVAAPNLVNACNLHVGDVYKVFISISDDQEGWPDIIKNYILFRHKIQKIKEVFNSDNGEVLRDENHNLRMKKVIDWPSLLSGNEDRVYVDKIVGFINQAASFVVPATVIATERIAYEAYWTAKWFSESYKELKGFYKLANKSNDFHIDEDEVNVTHGDNTYRIIRYKTKKVPNDYNNKSNMNVFTQAERQFLETYKLLMKYKDLPELFNPSQVFSTALANQELATIFVNTLEDYIIENEIISSNKLSEFIPYIKRMLHAFPCLKSEVKNAYDHLPIKTYIEIYASASSSYLRSIKSPLELQNDIFELKGFLTSDAKIMLTTQSNVSMGIVIIHKIFESLANRNNKNCVFLNSNILFSLGYERLIRFLNDITEYLLVLECSNAPNDKMESLVEDLIPIIRRKSQIKVIFVTKSNSNEQDCIERNIDNSDLKSSCRVKKVEVKFTDFAENSREELLSKEVVFQGNPVPLREILGSNISDLDSAIDSETIAGLLKNESIEVGKALPSLNQSEIMDWKFIRHVKINTAVLKEKNMKDLLAISNITEGELSQLINGEKVSYFSEGEYITSPSKFAVSNGENSKADLKINTDEDEDIMDLLLMRNINESDISQLVNGKKVCHFSESEHTTSLTKFVASDGENDKTNFETLCAYLKRNLHWLKKEENNFIWQSSSGNLSYIREYIDTTFDKVFNISDIINSQERFSIIAAEPGMGKSTILTYLGSRKADSEWFIQINLAEHKKQLEGNIDFTNDDDIINFLHACGEKTLSSKLTKKLMKSRFKGSGDIVLLLDGFDEIALHCRENVKKLLKKVQETKIKKVIISTGLHSKTALEDVLSTFAYVIQPFTEEDQKEFLRKFWRSTLDSDIDGDRLKNYAELYLGHIYHSMQDKERKFMGIPLQIKMFAEVLQDELKRLIYLKKFNHFEIYFPNGFDICKLYDRFMQNKYQIYFNNISVSVDLNDEKINKLFTTRLRQIHGSIAFSILYPEEKDVFLRDKLPSEDEKHAMKLIGMVHCINDELSFIHRSFAQYFMSDFLADSLRKKKGIEDYKIALNFLEKQLFKRENEMVNVFLNYHLATEKIHVAALKGKLYDVRETTPEIAVYTTDILGRNALHYAAQGVYETIVNALLEKGAKPAATDELGKNALHYAARYNRGKSVVNCLLEKESSCLHVKDKNGCTPVVYAVEQGNMDIVKLLIKKDADRDTQGNTPLHIAAQSGNAAMVDSLLEQNADVDAINANGKKPMYYATHNEHWGIVESLLKKSTEFSQLDDAQKISLYNYSVENSHWEIATLFLGGDINSQYLEHLTDQQKTDLLCFCISNGKSNLVEILMVKGTCINTTDGKGKKPICYAAEKGCWAIVEVLLQNGGNLVDLKTEEKISLMKFSAQKCDWKVLELLKNDSDIASFLHNLNE